MPNLINPLGDRLGKKLFWRGSYPVVYQTADQFGYFELVMNVRLLLSVLLIRILNIQPFPRVENHLHGILLSLLVNVWGARGDRCSVYTRIFDYKIVVLLLDINVRRYFIKQFAKLVTWGWVTAAEGGPLHTVFRTRIGLPVLFGGGGSLLLRLKRFINQYISRLTRVMDDRIHLWHYAVVAFTRPYLRWLMDKYDFAKLVFVTVVEHGSLTAGMLVRYLLLKLKQGFSLMEVIKNVRNGIHQVASFGDRVLGYKLCCSGRFTRKQIATYRWIRHGYLSLNQIEGGIDYAQGRGVSRYGAYGVKLWLFYG